MKIVCPTCQKVYNIPDERLPEQTRVSFPCPACKGKIQIDLVAKQVVSENTSPSQTEEIPVAEHDESEAQDEKQWPSGDELKEQIIFTFKDLPPMPEVVQKVREVMADPKLGFKDVGNVLETDPAFAAGILKLANSAYYGMSGMVTSIQQAAVVLGYKTLGQLVTVMGGLKLLGKSLKGYKMKSGVLWKHSLAVAYGAKKIANQISLPLENDAFSAGLVHDAGKIVLDPYVLERRDLFEVSTADENVSFFDAEKQIFGFSHADITYELCKKWNFPETQTIAVGYHHEPTQSDDDTLSYILHLADHVAVKAGFAIDQENENQIGIDKQILDKLDITEADVDALVDEITDTVEKISSEMNVA